MSRLKIDGTKVNIIEAKTNFIERIEYEKFYKIKDDISKIRKEHATLNQNYFTKNISSKVKYEGSSDFLNVIFPNSNQCLLKIKLKPKFKDTLKFTDLIFYIEKYKFENNIEDIFILGEIINQIQLNYDQILNELNQICLKIDPKVKKSRNEMLLIKRLMQSITEEENYKWMFDNLKEKLTTGGIKFDGINNTNYFKYKWYPTKIILSNYDDLSYNVLVYETEQSDPVSISYNKKSFNQVLDYIFVNSFYITNLEKNITYNHKEYKEKFGFPK